MPLGDQVQRRFDAPNHQGVARVVAALKPHHVLRGFGEPVHQLALALVTPLGAHHHHVPASGGLSLLCCHSESGR